MHSMMRGEASSSHIAALLMILKTRGETAQDINTMLEVMLEYALSAPIAGNTVDTCGTGGDGAHTVNISTMAAIVIAAAGVKVAKHGNRAASSKCGSADVLEKLGVPLQTSAAAVAETAEQVGITFFFAQAFHPALAHIGPTRRELGVPTIFNILGPLANPARPRAQVVGVANLNMAPIVADVLATRGTSALVVRGHDGLDEISTAVKTSVWSTLSGQVERFDIDPTQFGIATPGADALTGGDSAFNADVVSDLFNGVQSEKILAIRDAVAINAAAGLVAYKNIDNPVTDFVTGLQREFIHALEVIDSGAALRKLEEWLAFEPSK
jgi:anthranilate phosphoribosyltransferase